MTSFLYTNLKYFAELWLVTKTSTGFLLTKKGWGLKSWNLDPNYRKNWTVSIPDLPKWIVFNGTIDVSELNISTSHSSALNDQRSYRNIAHVIRESHDSTSISISFLLIKFIRSPLNWLNWTAKVSNDCLVNIAIIGISRWKIAEIVCFRRLKIKLNRKICWLLQVMREFKKRHNFCKWIMRSEQVWNTAPTIYNQIQWSFIV